MCSPDIHFNSAFITATHAIFNDKFWMVTHRRPTPLQLLKNKISGVQIPL